MKNYKSTTTLGCLPIIIIFAIIIGFNMWIGGVSVDYILDYFGKDIPAIADATIGLFVAEVSIPIAIVMFVLINCGVI